MPPKKKLKLSISEKKYKSLLEKRRSKKKNTSLSKKRKEKKLLDDALFVKVL